MKSANDLILGSFFLTIILLISIIVTLVATLSYQTQELPGNPVPLLPTQEIKLGEKHPPYNSIPPTSGSYIKTNQRDGIYNVAIPDEKIIYALKEKKVGIFFDCNYKSDITPPSPAPQLQAPESSLSAKTKDSTPKQTPQEMMAIFSQVQRQNQSCGEIISDLRKIVNKLGTKGLIMAPYGKIDARVALVAWGRIDKLRFVDEKRITKFVKAFRVY